MRDWTLVTGALSGIGRTIAIELSKTCNVILNGRDESRLAETAAACAEGCETKVWAFDLARVESVADAVAFLLSDRAAWITGQQLVVDGGSSVDVSA